MGVKRFHFVSVDLEFLHLGESSNEEVEGLHGRSETESPLLGHAELSLEAEVDLLDVVGLFDDGLEDERLDVLHVELGGGLFADQIDHDVHVE